MVCTNGTKEQASLQQRTSLSMMSSHFKEIPVIHLCILICHPIYIIDTYGRDAQSVVIKTSGSEQIQVSVIMKQITHCCTSEDRPFT
jgi:hypothetical protein